MVFLLPDRKETELGSSEQEASPSAGKNTRIVLVPCTAWKCVPTAISGSVDISEVPGYALLQHLSCQWRSHMLLQGMVSHELTVYLSVFDLFLTHLIMTILSKRCKPGNFESHNSLKASFSNTRNLYSNFVECKFHLVSNSPDILTVCETNLGDSIDSCSFSVTGYLPLIWKDSVTHMYGLAVYVKQGLLFNRTYYEQVLEQCLSGQKNSITIISIW